jgi:hypothetical protein
MTVVSATFLRAVGRALARIHVEHDKAWLMPLVSAGQIGESGEVLRPSQPLVPKGPI